MTIVHSFWSKPAMFSQCGFPGRYNIITNIFCYALSCTLLKQLGHKVVFYGDELSLKLFKVVPYDEMRQLNIPENANPIFQSLGKIYALQQMNDDEVYVSGDVVFKDSTILSLIDKDNNNDLVVQSIQPTGTFPYDHVCNEIVPVLRNDVNTNFFGGLKIKQDSYLCDSSILKFNNKLFKDMFVLSYLENYKIICDEMTDEINVDPYIKYDYIIEKQFLYQLGEKYGISINPLLGRNFYETCVNAGKYDIVHVVMATKLFQLANIMKELQIADVNLYNKVTKFCDSVKNKFSKK